MSKREQKTIATNRRARHDYEILRTLEAGIVLSGTEVCSLRENNCQIKDSFAMVRGGEAWLMGLHISPYSHGNIFNPDPDRNRKLLLHKKEIRQLSEAARERGMALVPLRLYFDEHNRVKVELAVCRGKKLYDKRDSIAKRDADRDIARAMKDRNR